jgi:hypothetical protein
MFGLFFVKCSYVKCHGNLLSILVLLHACGRTDGFGELIGCSVGLQKCLKGVVLASLIGYRKAK